MPILTRHRSSQRDTGLHTPALRVTSHEHTSVPVVVNVAHVAGGPGIDEFDLMLRPTEYASFATQIEWISRAYQDAIEALGLDPQTALFRRYFCSDLKNQTPARHGWPLAVSRALREPCAESWICQAPEAPARVAVWAHHLRDRNGPLARIINGSSLRLLRGELSHYWSAGSSCVESETSFDQTTGILSEYERFLRAQGMSLERNLIRTWLFVQNVDINYQGLVAARREFFALHGLTPETHFVASTGIEGTLADSRALIAMDAYAIGGIREEQITYLKAPGHLGPTHLYGVTFERATSVAYRDRKHVFISGTASIDPEGRVLHPGDAERQLDRAVENVRALLEQAGAALADLAILIAYARDPADLAMVTRKLRAKCGNVPLAVLHAPVCRPGWLVEIEGRACVAEDNPGLLAF
ncbi:MAG: translation initiation inhibitor [Candidatus Hydrogenedentes bacterium]|nr:translation initiation inhibitor [Candidatus Hydrogenedentota bacterium]